MKNKKDNILLGDYNITSDPNFLDRQNAITPELSKLIEKFYEMALEGKKSSVQKILEAIEKYPENPQLKNYLSVLYSQIGDTRKSAEINSCIIKEHPDYLFGKINLAAEYLQKKQYSKIPEILGEAMEIKALYPHRNTFHINEVSSFFKMAILYFSAIGKIEKAETKYGILKQLAPDSLDAEVAFKSIMMARMKIGAEKMKEEKENRITVKVQNQNNTEVKEALPVFTHHEVEQLYKKDLYIDKEVIEQILALPRITLIQDLEKILNDSIERFTYFSIQREENWEEETMNFVVHAIYLLGEIEATESMDSIFEVLSQSDSYMDMYLGDILTAALWEPVYKITNRDLKACYQFMCTPGIYTYSKTVISDVVEQVALHQPERKVEVVAWYRNVINFFLNSEFDDNIIDGDVIGLMICDIIDIKAKELLPEIELLFEKGIVSIGICGVFSDVNNAFDKFGKYDQKKEILSTIDRYKQITSTWAGYNENKDDSSFSDTFENYDTPLVPIRNESKIGRNEPCPCGSGKKYKKCCLNH